MRVVGGEITDEFQALVRPQVEIDPEASAFHGIVPGDVNAEETADVVLARFSAWVADDWMAAHNAAVDAQVLGFEYARARLEPPPGIVVDSLALARKAIPDAPDHKLDTLCEWLGFEEGPRHRALFDALWCWKVIEACIERLAGEGGSLTAAELLAQSGRVTTIEGAMPRLKRHLKPRWRPLAHACDERTGVTLLYGDGDAPAHLSVHPHLLFEMGSKNYLEAECGLSGTLKTYRLDRIHKVLA